MTTLRVIEIYPSIQGESTRAGLPCTFVRLAGCPLRCRWCDTVYSFSGGEPMTIDEITDEIDGHGIGLIELTGGEPLAQPGAPELLRVLCDRYSQVLLETSGSFPIEELDPRVGVIMDMKAPGSGEESRNLWQNLEHLKAGDELKIVISDRTDYDWAREVVEKHRPEVPVLFSPVFGELEPSQLSEWMLADRLAVRMQLQQHKYIWDPEARRT
ncbi:MAG TPA: radical SAM protein [Planctomycetes bacterium]|nr:radical SAM protein [Planctomycetota bacterium]